MLSAHLRPISLAAALLTASAAHALDLDLLATGSGIEQIAFDERTTVTSALQTTFLAQPDSIYPFTSLQFGYVLSDGYAYGRLSYYDDWDYNRLSANLAVDSDTTLGSVRTLTGTWSYDDGWEDYAGFDPLTSGGDWTFTWNAEDDTTVSRLTGTLYYPVAADPVPEPASFAAIGIGALGVMRRRRRA